MPFLKKYTEPKTKAVANYWAITSMIYDGLSAQTNFTIGVFVSEEAFGSGAQPIEAITFNDNEGQLTISQCEDIVKARPEFSDAVAI